MARTAIAEHCFSTLVTDGPIISALGPISAANRRVYSAWPQTQPALTGHEPAEGWCVFAEDATTTPDVEIYEIIQMRLDIFATRRSLADTVVDRADTYWHWQIWQERSLSLADRLIVMARRVKLTDQYAEAVKLYHRQVWYRLQAVLTPYTG